MSHFTVMVIGNNPEEQLAKYQENNCGDCPKEYLEFMDKAVEYEDEYENGSREMILIDGEYFYPWDSKFQVEITEEEYKKAKENKEKYLSEESNILSGGERKYYRNRVYPKEAKEVKVPHKERFETIEEYLENQGYDKDDLTGKYGYWENPNAKWDWYQLGGRWTGMLKLKDPELIHDEIAESDYSRLMKEHECTKEQIDRRIQIMINPDLETREENSLNSTIQNQYGLDKKLEEIVKIKYSNGAVGSKGLMTPMAEFGWVDRAKVGDIDWQFMRDYDKRKALEKYDKLTKLYGGEIPKIEKPWSEFIKQVEAKELEIDEAREIYHSQDALKKSKELSEKHFKNEDKEIRNLAIWHDLKDYQCTREEYGQRAYDNAIGTFAILMDGEWFEKGEMGWFGFSDTKIEPEVWAKQQGELIENLHESELVSIYDCHI